MTMFLMLQVYAFADERTDDNVPDDNLHSTWKCLLVFMVCVTYDDNLHSTFVLYMMKVALTLIVITYC